MVVGTINLPSQELKIAAGLGAMGLSYVAHDDSKEKTLEARRVKREEAYKGLVSFHRFVTPASEPVAPLGSLDPQTIDVQSSSPLNELSVNAAKYPHVLIVGATGSGKSTIAQGLAALSQGKRFAIAPHLDPAKLEEEWRSCHGVFLWRSQLRFRG
jgi:ABC-type transport system involved in cytochrome bd biosynthesis fused ATPase/permease subunit